MFIKLSKHILILLFLLLLSILFAVLFTFTKKPSFVDNIKPKTTTSWEELACLDILDSYQLEIGKKEMATHNTIIVGIARDNAKELPTVIKYIEHTGKFFQDYRVVVFENDSIDGTKTILKNWKFKNHKVKVLSKKYSNKKRPNIEFLAKIRNHYLRELKTNSEYKNFDMVMIVDLDMTYGWDMRGLFHSFSKITDWDAVCSNGIFTKNGRMWDMFAFRNKQYPENLTHPDYWSKIVPRGQKIYLAGTELVPVQSCFGGLAFYKKLFINGCEYKSVDNDCEHIAFHQCLTENQGRIFMNPSQILRYSHYE